jgi:cyanophycin synthetase
MQIQRIWNIGGPNVWARVPVLEAWVELGELKTVRTDAAPEFCERLFAWLPGLAQHSGPAGEAAGFVRLVHEGTTLAHVLERVAIELQTRAGHAGKFGRTQPFPKQPGLYKVVIEYQEPVVGEACLECGRRLCLAAMANEPFDLRGELERLTDLVEWSRYGRTTAAIKAAALKRNIPVEHLNPDDGRLMALGWGCKQHWVLAAETAKTSDLAQLVSQDKELTKSLLRLIGVPVPRGRPVTSAEDAWAAAEELDGPVVVKPRDRDLSVGVRARLTTREEVVAAYELARQKSEEVIVEQYASGYDHRVLLVGGKVVAACRIEPPQVWGDGRSTISQLIEEANAESARGDGYTTPRAKILLDESARRALAAQGYTLDAVPPAGTCVRLRYDPPPFESGGAIVDVTDDVHPQVAARLAEAVHFLGLDVAGIDVVAENLERPLEEQGGMVLEVNAGPALWLHMAPWCDPPRPVAEAIVASLIPEGDDGRIPIAAITGVNGKTTVTWLLAHILRTAGRKVGMACSEGVYIDGRCILQDDCSGPRSARAVLRNPQVEIAVLETARGGVLREGLGFDCCDVAVVTNIGEGDHLGMRGVETREELAHVKATVVKAVSSKGYAVLNAADPLVAAMAEQCAGEVVYFAPVAQHPLVKEHLGKGGRAVVARNNQIFFAVGEREEPLVAVAEVPLTYGGRVTFQVDNVLAAAAAAWVLGLSAQEIAAGLRTFVTSQDQAPGRFSVFPLGGATVIVDYAHNSSALTAMAAVLDGFPHRRRTILFSSCDRRNDDVIRQGEVLGSQFDRVILAADSDHPDQREVELNALLRRGIAKSRRAVEVREYPNEQEALAAALDELQPDDLLVVGPAAPEEALAAVCERQQRRAK